MKDRRICPPAIIGLNHSPRLQIDFRRLSENGVRIVKKILVKQESDRRLIFVKLDQAPVD